MAEKKSGKKKLTSRQHVFVKNLAKGASQKDAFIAAGYKAKHPDQGAHQALKQIQSKVPQIMDQMGLTDHRLIEKYLVPLLAAEETTKREGCASTWQRWAFVIRRSTPPSNSAAATHRAIQLRPRNLGFAW